jgi:hypothetical protein
MKRTMRFLALTLAAIAIFASIIAPSPVAAAGISAEPNSGGLDTTYTFNANGFQVNEIVDTWVGIPNLSAVKTGTFKANSAGAVAWSFKPTTSNGGGEYIAVARGRVSGEVSVKFNVGAPPQEPDPKPTTAPPVVIAPISDRTAQFNARGFQGGELVNTWYQSPDGTITGYKNFYADAWGNLTFPFVMNQGQRFGGWQVVGRGIKSGVQQWITFSWFGTVTDVRASNPIQQVSPYYDWVQGGFAAGEAVTLWIGFPNGGVQTLATVTANGSGTVSYRVNVQPGWQFGGYVVAGYGAKSHVTKWQRFSWFGNETQRIYP